MPVFTTQTLLACPPAKVWDFLIRPANVTRVSPPDLNLTLIDGPDVLSLGARITVQGRRWGVAQRISSEVTAFEPEVLLVDEQCEGPLPKWVHTHRLEAVPEGTRMTDQIEFEPPGGLLGFVVTARRIEQELQAVFAYRAECFKELLEG